VFVASAFVLCVRGVVSCLGTGDGICAPAAVSPLVLSLSSRAARESRVLSPSIKARACFPRASISARPFTSGGPGDFGRCRRSGLPRARLGLVGDANEYLRGGLRGGSFRGLGGLSDTRLVGDRENRRGGCFKGLVCLSSRGIWDREEGDMRRGGCFKGLDRPSPPTGEDVFLLFLAGSSMAVGDATMRRCDDATMRRCDDVSCVVSAQLTVDYALQWSNVETVIIGRRYSRALSGSSLRVADMSRRASRVWCCGVRGGQGSSKCSR
jgi:hypothetical protein